MKYIENSIIGRLVQDWTLMNNIQIKNIIDEGKLKAEELHLFGD